MKKRVLYIILFIIAAAGCYSQTILEKPFNPETFPEWDAYVKKYAPSDSALSVVQNMAMRNFMAARYIVCRGIFEMYKPYFKPVENYMDQQITMYEQYSLLIAPTPDIVFLYDSLIRKKAPDVDAFIAVQRVAEPYVTNKDWDSAAYIYKKYKPLFPGMEKKFDAILDIINAPSQGIVINNLGPAINSATDEWDPNPTPDGQELYFSASNRPDGFGKADVYVSKMNDGKWQKPENLGRSINGEQQETIDNITADGNELLLSGDFEGTFGQFDIYSAKKTKEGWSSLQHFPMPINSKYLDEGACMTSDGKAIIFTSDRPGGVGDTNYYGLLKHGSLMGNMDIYVCIKTDTGWSKPINLGNVINTPLAERSPFLHPDGKTLYFSSEGHPGLGRLDVFKSVRLKEDSWTEWSEPVNLGKEINTALDDWGYKVGLSGDSAFFASNYRNEGMGGWDLYSVKIPENFKPEKVMTIRGRVRDLNGQPLSATIKWEDLSTGKNIGVLQSNPRDGSYIILLPFGKNYGYFAEKDGYYPTSNNINLKGKKSGKSDVIREDIIMVSLSEMEESGRKVRINNIFFDFDEYELKPESEPELNRLASLLINSKQKVEIDGHTDNTGTESYNRELSRDRAKAVMEYLIDKGINKNRLIIKGLGDTNPVAPNDTEENKAKNRRVEIWFVK